MALPAFSLLDQISGFAFSPGNICWYNFAIFFTFSCFLTDLVIMQINSFLAVYWNAKYNGRVTPFLAYICCVISKLICIFLTILVGYLDPDYTRCTVDYAFMHLKSLNIYFISYPKLFVALILIIVAVYMLITMIILENKVQPTVNLPTIPTVSEQRNDVEQQDVVVSYRVERSMEDPFKFERVQVAKRICGSPHNPVQPSPLFSKAKKAFIMNLLTLILLSIIMIPSILTIIHRNCTIEGDCADYLQQYRVSAPFRGVSHFLYIGLLIKKLEKI